MKILTRTSAARGFSLLEVLVSMFVLAMGLLGLAGLQTRVSVAEMESYQRTQALILVQNMVDRIATNGSALRADIGHGTSLAVYTTVLNSTDVGGAEQSCTGSGAALDLCEWGNQIAGVSEKNGSSQNIGTLTNGRGCIRRPDAADPYLYLVVVSWQGRIASKSPPTTQIDCGSGTGSDAANYTAANKRRVVALPVRIAKLT
jgi:type IV pilus assembly protein PilV